MSKLFILFPTVLAWSTSSSNSKIQKKRGIVQNLVLISHILILGISTPAISYAQPEEIEPTCKNGSLVNLPEEKKIAGGSVIVPRCFDQQKHYPVLFILPYTGGHPKNYYSGDFRQKYIERLDDQFLVVLLDITGRESDYTGPAGTWESTLQRYENLIQSGLKELSVSHKVDSSRILLAGSSLGGDLSWALAQRNPKTFRGAVVINSMSLWYEEQAMQQLASSGKAFFMVISESDQKDRVPAMRVAVGRLAKHGVEHKFWLIPPHIDGLRTKYLMEGVDYVLFSK